MRNQGYDLPDWDEMTWDECYSSPDRAGYLPYWGWWNDSHTKFSEVPVSHDDFPHLFYSLSFFCSTPPSPKNTKLSHPSLSLHAMIMSYHQVQHTPSTALSHDPQYPAHSQFLISRRMLLYSTLCNPTNFKLTKEYNLCCRHRTTSHTQS